MKSATGNLLLMAIALNPVSGRHRPRLDKNFLLTALPDGTTRHILDGKTYQITTAAESAAFNALVFQQVNNPMLAILKPQAITIVVEAAAEGTPPTTTEQPAEPDEAADRSPEPPPADTTPTAEDLATVDIGELPAPDAAEPEGQVTEGELPASPPAEVPAEGEVPTSPPAKKPTTKKKATK